MDNPVPDVSVIVPCRNERDYIETCLRSILEQEPPPGGFEVIVADGMSDDGTRDILTRLIAENLQLRVINNPGRITSCGMNAGIRKARGKYIAIMGAHTDYAPDYIYQCVKLLEDHPEICCSGGPILSKGRTVFGMAVASAMSHPVGIGNAKHRLPKYEGYAEGACFPMFRREIFDKVGLYDESLVRNQDDDFNYRAARGGAKIYISPRAWSHYWVRESPIKLFYQYFQYGYWRVAVLRKHGLPASWRQLAPVGLYCLMLILFFFGLSLPSWWRLTAAALPVAYILLLIGTGLAVTVKQGPAVGILFPLAVFAMHLAYAVGFVWGLIHGKTLQAASRTDGQELVQ